MRYEIPYRIYSKETLLNESINKRGDSRLIFTLFFKINHLSFGVVYEADYFKNGGPAHFSFHALSRGFEAFTSTGYHSIFVHDSKKISSYAEIKSYLFEKINQKMDLEKASTQPLQLNLFEM